MIMFYLHTVIIHNLKLGILSVDRKNFWIRLINTIPTMVESCQGIIEWPRIDFLDRLSSRLANHNTSV